MMLLSCRSEFDASFLCGWVSRSLGQSDGLCRRSLSTLSLSRLLGQSVRWVVPSPFLWLNVSWRGSWLSLFFVFVFVFVWALREGGAARGWRCLRAALLEGGAARG
jgi:hypothetical protein